MSVVFNGENKQHEVKNSSGQTIGRYLYDGEGKRVKKITWNSQGASETTIFVYSAERLVAKSEIPNEMTRYLTEDHLGTPRVITDSEGNVISRRDFLPFGEEITLDIGARASLASYQPSTDNVKQKFTGYQKDIETGLDFAEARMYENRHGRFTAVDPLLASGKSANPQTFNRYTYVMNSPLVNTDPTGLQTNQRSGFTGTVYTNGQGQYRRTPGDGWTEYTGPTVTITDNDGTWRVVGTGENQGIFPVNQYVGRDSSCVPAYQCAGLSIQPTNLADEGIGIEIGLRRLANTPITQNILGPPNLPYYWPGSGWNSIRTGVSLRDFGVPLIVNDRQAENWRQSIAAFGTELTAGYLLTRGAGALSNIARANTSVSSYRLALGIGNSETASQFARATNSSTYVELTQSRLFIPEKFEKLARNASEINFNFGTRATGTQFSVRQFAEWQRNGRPLTPATYTMQELDYVLSNPDILRKTRFHVFPGN